MDPTSSNFLQLPLEVLEMITNHSLLAEKSRLSRCNKDFHSLLKPLIYQTIHFGDGVKDFRSANLLCTYRTTAPWKSPFHYMVSTKQQRMNYNSVLLLTSTSLNNTILSSLQHPTFHYLRHLTIPSEFSELTAELLGPSSYLRRHIESISTPPGSPIFDDLVEHLDSPDLIFQGYRMCPIDQYHFAMYFSLIREETCDEESKSEYPEFTPSRIWTWDAFWKHYHVHTHLSIEYPPSVLLVTPDPFWSLAPAFPQLRTLEFGTNSLLGPQIIRSILRTNILPSLLDLTILLGTDHTENRQPLGFSQYRFTYSDWLLLRRSSGGKSIEVIYGTDFDPIEMFDGRLEGYILEPLDSTESALVEKFLSPYLGPNLNRLCLEIPQEIRLDIGTTPDW